VKSSESLREGHRATLRARLLAAETLDDADLLELALAPVLPGRDARPVADALIHRFGDLPGAIRAPLAALHAVEGLGDAGIAALRTLEEAARRLGPPLAYRPLLNNQDRLTEYLTDVLPRIGLPARRALYLEKANRLIADEALPCGADSAGPAAGLAAALVIRARALAATALIVVRGSTGEPSPTEQDIATARAVKRKAAAASILLHDHVIVGGAGSWISLRRLGLL
jgi:DNA repair protein RadC